MRQILHIFRKDVRHLWPQILIVAALFEAFDTFQILSSPLPIPEAQRLNNLSGLTGLLLTLAIWYLIAVVVYQEPLPGDRQFWLTAPYSRKKLFLAKALFVVVFVNALLFISDCIILGGQTLPVLHVLPRLLLRQLPFTALYILAAFAIATVTRNVAQFVLAWFVVLLGFIAQLSVFSLFYGAHVSLSLEDVAAYSALALVTTFVIAWQYARRQMMMGRIVLIAFAFVGVPIVSALANWATPRPRPESSGPGSIHISYASGTASTIVSGTDSAGWVTTQIPLRVEGLPPESILESNDQVSIEMDGKPWTEPDWHPTGSIHRFGDQYWEVVHLPEAKLALIKGRPANLQSVLHCRLFTDRVQSSIPVSQGTFRIAGFGRCFVGEVQGSTELVCRVGLDAQRMAVNFDKMAEPAVIFEGSKDSALPSGLSPVLQTGAVGSAHPTPYFEFIPRREITSFERTISMTNTVLSNYVPGQ